MAAGEASPGWVTLLLQACGAHLHGQGCQPSHIPVPTPYGHFPPLQDHVDPSTPSIPSSDPLHLQRSQGGSWGVFPPPHSFCWWVTPHSHLSQACRWRGEEYLVPGQFSNACSLLSAGGRCLHLRLMHILTPQGGRPLLPGHLHHQGHQDLGQVEVPPLTAGQALLFFNPFYRPPPNFIPIFQHPSQSVDFFSMRDSSQ